MSISTTSRKAGPFTGNGVTVSFPFAFKVFAAADVLVVRGEIATSAEVELTLGTHYTVTLNSNQDSSPGGTVNWIGTPLSSAFTLTLGSKVASTQPANFTNLGRFYPRVLNDALDRLTIVVQQLAEEVSRSVKVGFSGLVSPDELVDTITTAASTAATAAGEAAGSAEAAFLAVADAQDAVAAANAAIVGAVQKDGSVAMTGALVLPGNAVNALEAVPKQQAETIANTAAASVVTNRMQHTLTASQATTSGTAIDFTGIPSWAKRITVIAQDVSTNGGSQVLLQVGDSGGVSASGYVGGNLYYLGGSSGAHETLSSGFRVFIGGAGIYRFGTITLTRLTANKWVAVGQIAHAGGFAWVSGVRVLANTLDRVRFTTVGGTDAFTQGEVSLLIEG